jgi:hypothetical protein
MVSSDGSDIMTDTLSENPQFVDEDNRDFSLQKSSPIINAGTWLPTTNAGSGRQIAVKDVCYFMDNWGLMDGDLIQLEGPETNSPGDRGGLHQ